MAGNAPCSPCPARSHALAPAAPVCPCLEGFFRASSDPPEAPCTGEFPTYPRDGIGMQWGQERVSLRAMGWLVGICSDFFLLCPCFPSPPLFPAAPLPAHLGSSLHCLLPFYFPHHLHPTTPYSRPLSASCALSPQAPRQPPGSCGSRCRAPPSCCTGACLGSLGAAGTCFSTWCARSAEGPGARALVAAVGTRCISTPARGA